MDATKGLSGLTLHAVGCLPSYPPPPLQPLLAGFFCSMPSARCMRMDVLVLCGTFSSHDPLPGDAVLHKTRVAVSKGVGLWPGYLVP